MKLHRFLLDRLPLVAFADDHDAALELSAPVNELV